MNDSLRQLQLLGWTIMMKTYKLHTINLASDIFLAQNEPAEQIAKSIKAPFCNKRFKYNYEKSKPNGSSSLRREKNRRSSIDSEEMMPQIGQLTTMFHRETKEIHHASSNPRNRRSTLSHQITLQQHEQLEAKEQKTGKQGSKTPQGSEKVHQIKSMNYVLINLKREHDQGEKKSAVQLRPAQIGCQSRCKQAPAVSIIKEKSKQSKNTSQLIKARNNSSSKYTNSIIKSYQVKTIDLMDPLHNNRKKYLLRGPQKPGPAYYIDLGNDQNLKQIYLEDLQKVQLKKCVYDHKRAFSNHAKQHKRLVSRPFTPNIFHKFEDFEPKPWDSEQRPDYLYQSKVQNLD